MCVVRNLSHKLYKIEKLKKQFKVDYSLDWEYGIEITKLREDLDALEKLGATHIDIEPYNSYDCAYVEIEAKCERFETDQEFENRVAELKRREQAIKNRELEQLEKLKLKYGK